MNINKTVWTIEIPFMWAQAGVWKQIRIRVWYLILVALLAISVLVGMSMANASQPTTLAERPYTMSEISNSSWPRNLVAVEGAKIENGVMEMKVDQDEFDLESIFVDFGQLADVFEIDESAIIWFAHEAPNPISADTIQIQAPDDEYGTPGTFVSGLTRRQ